MATHERIFQKMHEYETRVLLALGFTSDSPVLLREVSAESGYVTFKFYSDTAPEVPAAIYEPGVTIYALEWNEAIEYLVPYAALADGVWDTIMEARREWESNFPRLHP